MFLMLTCMSAWAQSIKITSFNANLTNYGASYAKVYDNNHEVCARIRFTVQNPSLKVEGNLGVVKMQRLEGEVWAYVPQGTKTLTLRCGGAMLRYNVPVEIESMVTYDANVELSSDIARQRKHVVYVMPAYNIISISGPAVNVGATLGRHNFEIGAVVGLKKSDDLFFYSNDETLRSAHNYKAIRVQARYGYSFPLTDFLQVIPQVGVAGNFISGSDVAGVTVSETDYMESASSLSALVAARFTVELSRSFFVQVTPEYDFGLYKSNECKVLNNGDSTIKKWTDGFNLSVGLIIYF